MKKINFLILREHGFWKDNLANLRADGITPKKQMEECIEIAEIGSAETGDRCKAIVELVPLMKDFDTLMTNGTPYNDTPAGTRKKTPEDLLNRIVCMCADPIPHGELVTGVKHGLTEPSKYLYWLYLDLEDLCTRLMEGEAYA